MAGRCRAGTERAAHAPAPAVNVDYLVVGVVSALAIALHVALFVLFRRWMDRDLALSFAGDDPGRRAWMLARLAQNDQADEAAHSANGALMVQLGRVMLEARRAALIAARDERKLDDEVLREVLVTLDLQQALLANWNEGDGR